MPNNENDPKYGQFTASGAVLIVIGLAVAFLSPQVIEFGLGEYLTEPFWYVGWLLVAVGGWLLPNRLVAGIFIGIAIASIGYFLLVWYSTRNGMG